MANHSAKLFNVVPVFSIIRKMKSHISYVAAGSLGQLKDKRDGKLTVLKYNTLSFAMVTIHKLVLFLGHCIANFFQSLIVILNSESAFECHASDYC